MKQKVTGVNGSTNINDIHIKTKNCVDKEKIRDHIQQNTRIIKHWYKQCKETDESIVICSAGPSLDPVEIRRHYNKGTKIVAVKHALKELQAANIIPWAVILLDPRSHVGDFIDDIHPDSLVFVASMVDPDVATRLVERGHKVIGYHVAVGANEHEFLSNGDCLIMGGSATATRGISVLEGLGFKNMDLYGYDCCYYKKPNLKEKKEDGRLKYEEITIDVETYGDQKKERTFWTEGQFLAQLQEFRNYYFQRASLNLTIHGDGMIPWVWRNKLAHKRFLEEQEREAERAAPTLDKYLERLGFNGTHEQEI